MFSEELLQLLKSKGVSHEEFAARANISERSLAIYWSRYRRENNKPLKLKPEVEKWLTSLPDVGAGADDDSLVAASPKFSFQPAEFYESRQYADVRIRSVSVEAWFTRSRDDRSTLDADVVHKLSGFDENPEPIRLEHQGNSSWRAKDKDGKRIGKRGAPLLLLAPRHLSVAQMNQLLELPLEEAWALVQAWQPDRAKSRGCREEFAAAFAAEPRVERWIRIQELLSPPKLDSVGARIKPREAIRSRWGRSIVAYRIYNYALEESISVHLQGPYSVRDADAFGFPVYASMSLEFLEITCHFQKIEPLGLHSTPYELRRYDTIAKPRHNSRALGVPVRFEDKNWPGWTSFRLGKILRPKPGWGYCMAWNGTKPVS